MNLYLNHSVALISGGSSGIGLACALRLQAEGAQVAVIGRDPHKLEQARLRLGPDALVLRGDCGQTGVAVSLVEQVYARWGRLDVLVNCAGRAGRFETASLGEAEWRNGFESKFLPYVLMQDAVLAAWAQRPAPATLAAQRAVVHVIGSGGKIPSPQHLTGGAANAALMLATVGAARHYAAAGLRINAVNPYLIERSAEQQDDWLELTQLPAELAAPDTPAQRKGIPWEVANVVAFLASPLASYVNGAIVPVDGAAKAVI